MNADPAPSHQKSREWRHINGIRAATYYLIIILVGFVASILGPSLPTLAANTGAQLALLGSLFTVRSLGGLIGSSLSGRLYDRFTGHRVLMITLIGLALSLAVTPLLSSVWLLWIFIFLWGLSESFLDVGVNTQLVWTYRARVSPYLNALHFFFGVGALLAPLLYVRSIDSTGQLNLAYWSLALAMLPLAIWVASISSPKSPASDPTSNGETTFSVPVLLICLVFFLYVGAEVSYGGWIYTYALESGLGNINTAGYLNSAFWGMLTFGRLLAIPAAMRIRPSQILTFALIGCLLSLGLLWLPNTTPQLLWIGTLGLGFSMAPIFPTMLAVAGRRLAMTGRVTGWFFVASNAGGMTVPWLTGLFIQALGPQSMMPLLFLDVGLAALTFAVLIAILPGGQSPATNPDNQTMISEL